MSGRIGVEDVAELIRKQLKKKLPADTALTAETELESVGLSSLDVTEIFFGIEERVGFELDPTAGADVKTIGDLVTVVNGMGEQTGAIAEPAGTAGA
jgi:acyl carrier protein